MVIPLLIPQAKQLKDSKVNYFGFVGGNWVPLPWIELGYFSGTQARASNGYPNPVHWLKLTIR